MLSIMTIAVLKIAVAGALMRPAPARGLLPGPSSLTKTTGITFGYLGMCCFLPILSPKHEMRYLKVSP
jgi:hypothetical protein